MKISMAFVVMIALAGSARSQMLQARLVPGTGAPAINFSAPLFAAPSLAGPALAAAPTSLMGSLLPAPAIAPAPIPAATPAALAGVPPAAARSLAARPAKAEASPAEAVAAGKNLFDGMKVYAVNGLGGGIPVLTFGDKRRAHRYAVRYEASQNFGSGELTLNRPGRSADSAPLTRKALMSLRKNLRAEVKGYGPDEMAFASSRMTAAMLKFTDEQVRIAGITRERVLAKVAEGPALADDEILVVFKDGTSRKNARQLIESHQTMNGLSWERFGRTEFKSLPGGRGYYALLKMGRAGDRVGRAIFMEGAAMAGYALARDPGTIRVKLGRHLKTELDRLLK